MKARTFLSAVSALLPAFGNIISVNIGAIADTAGLVVCATAPAFAAKKPQLKKSAEPSPLEKYAIEAARQSEQIKPIPGSLWTPASTYGDLSRDPRASQLNDVVTIVVSESASAVSTGASKTARKSSLQSSVTALAGPTKATGALANLANLGSSTSLDGSGTTSRATSLTTTLSARVKQVLPNGYLLVEGYKQINVNSEHQTIIVRGVVRPADLAPDNSVPSTRLAQMEIQLDGKGVVNDSIRRPNFLYRILMNLLPF